MIGVGQHMPFSFLPESEGDAIRLEDFLRRLVAEVGSPLIRRFRSPEQSAIFDPANQGDRVPTMPIILNRSGFQARIGKSPELRNY